MSENKKKPNRIVNYFKEVKGEMKKVAWPTYKQIQNNTIIVIIAVIVIGLLVALLDLGFGKGFEFIVNKDAKTEQVEVNDEVLLDNVEIDGDAVELDPEANAEAGEEDAE